MKILLIQPMHEKQGDKVKTSISFPWGLAIMAKLYKDAGHDVTVLDGQALQKPKRELLRGIDSYDFDAVGITAFSTQYPAIKLFSEFIKANRGNIPILLGGPLATYQAPLVLQNTDVDICVIGDGEISGVEVLDNLDDLGRVDGIAFSHSHWGLVTKHPQQRFIPLDDLSLPDFSMFDMDRYLNQRNPYAGRKAKGKSMTVITSRGCPYKCRFCSKSNPKARVMSPNAIISMLTKLKGELGLNEVVFSDELFLSSKTMFRELAPALKSLNLPWGGQARVNLMDKEFLDMIKASGCIGLGYGIESGSQKILDNMAKGITVSQIEFAMKYTKALKIPIKAQLIFGYPGEDETTVQETIDLFDRVDHPGRRFNVIVPIPGSYLYDYSIKEGLIYNEEKFLYDIEKSFGIGKVHVNFTQWPYDEIYPRKAEVERIMEWNYYGKHPVKGVVKQSKETIKKVLKL